MSRKIRVAFQGGGARLISLLAAAEALHSLGGDGDIEVEAVSGSSAGSIAALAFGSQINLAELKKAIKDHEVEISRKFKKKGYIGLFISGLIFFIFGRPIFRYSHFNDTIGSILSKCGIDVKHSIEDVSKIPIYITVSDIYKGQSLYYKEKISVRDAIRKSCSIPFVFGTFKSEDQGQYSDGGMFDNLPIEKLLQHGSSDVPVFAIGFREDTQPAAKSSTKYMLSVATSMISNKMSSSKRLIGPEYVCEVQTELTTLDFDKIVSQGIDNEYDRIYDSTKAFFQRWLSGEGKSTEELSVSNYKAATRLQEMESRLLRSVEDSFRSVQGRYRYVRFSVRANCLENPRLADELRTEQLLELPPEKVISSIFLPLVKGAGHLADLQSEVRLDGPNGEVMPHEVFFTHDHMTLDGTNVPRNSLVILFRGDLSAMAGKKLYILKRETRYGFMAPLKKGSDKLAIRAQYWGADELSIRFETPRDVSVDWSGNGASGSVVGTQVPRTELPQGWYGFGASLSNVDQHGRLLGTFDLKQVVSGVVDRR